MSFIAALQFLTSLPIKRAISPEKLGRAAAWFPAVGLFIGLVLAGLNWLLNLVLPTSVTNALLIVALVLMTGAMHLDGLSDTCDGLAGHKTVEERWRIMRDSHAGAFGVVGVVLVLLVKYAALNSLPPALMTPALIFLPVAGRWAMTYAIFAYPYARPSGLGTVFKQNTRWPQFTIATMVTLASAGALYILCQLTALFLLLGVWLMTVIAAACFRRKFAGLTGDTYGAINEIAEVAVLILAGLLAHTGLA